MGREEYSAIAAKVSEYNLAGIRGNLADYVSPFIARGQGKAAFAAVAEQIDITVEELDEFLNEADKNLPKDYLFG